MVYCLYEGNLDPKPHYHWQEMFLVQLGPTYEYSGSANINIWWIDIAGSFNAGVITLSVMACLGGLLRHLVSFGNYHVSIYCTPDQSLWSFVDKDLSLTPLIWSSTSLVGTEGIGGII